MTWQNKRPYWRLGLTFFGLLSCGSDDDHDDRNDNGEMLSASTKTAAMLVGEYVGNHTADVSIMVRANTAGFSSSSNTSPTQDEKGIPVTVNKVTADDGFTVSFTADIKIPAIDEVEEDVSFVETIGGIVVKEDGVSYHAEGLQVRSARLGELTAEASKISTTDIKDLAHVIVCTAIIKTETFPNEMVRAQLLLLGVTEISLEITIALSNFSRK